MTRTEIKGNAERSAKEWYETKEKILIDSREGRGKASGGGEETKRGGEGKEERVREIVEGIEEEKEKES